MNQVYNQSKIAFHEEKLKSLAEEKVTSPVYVRIKPTNQCNHKCFYCSYDPDFGYLLSEKKYAQDKLPRNKMTEILDDLKVMGVKAVTYSGGGEPLVYQPIIETMKKTLELGIELSIITNGQRLNDERAEVLAKSEWVRISADYCNPELFTQHRKIPKRFFGKLEKNVKNFAKIKKSECEFGINFLVTHLNAEAVYESAKFFKDIGVNHIRFSPIFIPEGNKISLGGSGQYHELFRKEVLGQIEKAKEFEDESFKIFNSVQTDFDSVMASKRPYTRCFMMETVPVIAANQKVYFCHDKAYSDTGLLGSIENCSFKELWFSEKSRNIFRGFEPKKSCTHHCTADGRNIVAGKIIKNLDEIEKFIPKSEKHKNFI